MLALCVQSLLEWKESQVESNEGGSVASASAKKLRSDAEAKQSAKPQEESLTNADVGSCRQATNLCVLSVGGRVLQSQRACALGAKGVIHLWH